MKDLLSERLTAMIASPVGIRIRRTLGIGPAPISNHEIDGIKVAGQVVVYFSDVPNRSYQLQQWLPVLERLHETHPVVLVFRKVPTFRQFRRLTSLPKIFLRRYDDLMNFYEFNDFKLALYVNNGVANFQSLSAPQIVHVHVNHGESDKLSMVSNQAKAYDKTFVAGPAAIERHAKALVDFDLTKLVQVGRPQLDQFFNSRLPPFAGTTVLYAPTWEGENEANNYSSLILYGERIVSTLASIPELRVVYKPHPRIFASLDPETVEAHTKIVSMLHEQNSIGKSHIISETENILDLFEDTNVLVTDISSVGLDFLYLHPQKPLVLAERRNDLVALHEEAPISRCCPVISASTVDELLPNIQNHFDGSLGMLSRLEMRKFYFGDFSKGQSTEKFLETVGTLIRERATKLPMSGLPRNSEYVD